MTILDRLCARLAEAEGAGDAVLATMLRGRLAELAEIESPVPVRLGRPPAWAKGPEETHSAWRARCAEIQRRATEREKEDG